MRVPEINKGQSVPIPAKKRIRPCNENHGDFLYYIEYKSVKPKTEFITEFIKVCRSCYTNEDCFNNKKFIVEIRTLEGALVWREADNGALHVS